MKESAAFYPYHFDMKHMFRYKEFIPYEIKSAISPSGFSLDGIDAGEDFPANILITSDYLNGIADVDTVIFNSNSKDIYSKIETAIQENKNIVTLKKLDLKMKQHFSKICIEKKLKFANYSYSENTNTIHFEREIYDNDVPVILVCGMADTTCKIDIQLSMRHYFKKNGYRIAQISSKSYGSFYGMHNFPAYLYENQNEYDKILYFNHFVKEIEVSEKPDVIIIGVPGGIIPLDKKFNNEFGWLMYLISNAVKFDAVIFSMTFYSYEDNFISYIKDYCRFRYGFDISLFHLSNIFQDLSDNGNLHLKRYITATKEQYKSEYQKYKNNVYNIFDENDAEQISIKIIEELSNYIS